MYKFNPSEQIQSRLKDHEKQFWIKHNLLPPAEKSRFNVLGSRSSQGIRVTDTRIPGHTNEDQAHELQEQNNR